MPSATSELGEKPSTRGSIRRSLSFAKAFAMAKDADATVKKSHGRLSSVNIKPEPSRQSIGESKPPSPPAKRLRTPESNTVTRRRMSAVIPPQRHSSDEPPPKSAEGSVASRTSSLRPRPATSSGLPKYRPKSIVQAESSKRTSSPVQKGTRKRLSSSGDETEELSSRIEPDMDTNKASRPISPLPHRVALKANLTSAINATPPPPPKSKVKNTPSAKDSPSSSRPTKTVKTSALPRPPSSSSSSSSVTPRTPTTNGGRTAGSRSHGAHGAVKRTPPARQESPLARRGAKASSTSTPNASPSRRGNMSLISEGNSEDGDVEDVMNLLAPTARMTEPTPAMPRLLRPRYVNPAPRQQPLPPDPDTPPSMRQRTSPSSNEKAARGSILSWEQLANQSQSLDEDDIASMLADIPAPFQSGSGTTSPTRSSMLLSVPDSPCLSAMSSPGNFGSISQVLLPDVTPSPAVHVQQRYDRSPGDVDAAIVTLLRLQLASAESTSKERLKRLQVLEEENHNLRQAHARDVHELSAHIGELENHTRGTLEARERNADEQAAYILSLEAQLAQVDRSRDAAIEQALSQARRNAASESQAALELRKLKWEQACSARVASTQWASVHALLEDELDRTQSDRDILTLLHNQLAVAEAQLLH